MRSLTLTTSDGHELAADIAEPPPGVAVRGGAVICHPHPLYGGNRFNTVVESLFDALPAAGFVALRFDFRAAHDEGRGERLDVVAALDALAATGAAPLVATGYSFGALVALSSKDPRIIATVAIAPPLTERAATSFTPTLPTLLLTPAHDQICPPDQARAITADWTGVELEVVESTDHFFAGRADAAAVRAAAWLTAIIDAPTV